MHLGKTCPCAAATDPGPTVAPPGMEAAVVKRELGGRDLITVVVPVESVNVMMMTQPPGNHEPLMATSVPAGPDVGRTWILAPATGESLASAPGTHRTDAKLSTPMSAM